MPTSGHMALAKYPPIFTRARWILLTYYYPRSAGHSTPIWPHITQAVNNIRYFLHYFTSERLRNFLSPQFEKKKSNEDSTEERTWTEDHSLKNLRSIHLGYQRVGDCRWKKVDQTISDRTATDNLYQHCSVRYTETRRFRLALFE